MAVAKPRCGISLYFFFLNDTAPTEIYTLSLHDALPIFADALGDLETAPDGPSVMLTFVGMALSGRLTAEENIAVDRKSTRLNSSHSQISYAVFCLKKTK